MGALLILFWRSKSNDHGRRQRLQEQPCAVKEIVENKFPVLPKRDI
jgi:hypothetical protein